MMIRRSIAACSVVLLATSPIAGGAEATRPLVMSATFGTRTSLRVSSSDLRFSVSAGAPAETVIVEFTAAARVRPDADVVLTVEGGDGLRAVGGSASPDLVVSFQGDGQHAGTLREAGPHIAGAWKGSGVHHGQIRFTLGGATAAGTYLLPLKFVLSAG
jgi:hypothetical protein